MRCAPYGATNVFPEAWGAPHGPMLATGGPAIAGFFPQLPATPQSSRANDNLGKQATPDLTYFQKHGELHMGPCSAMAGFFPGALRAPPVPASALGSCGLTLEVQYGCPRPWLHNFTPSWDTDARRRAQLRD